MKLDLTSEQAQLLDRVLTGYLTDLRVEVRATDNHRFRQDLKREQAMLREIVEGLEASPDFARRIS